MICLQRPTHLKLEIAKIDLSKDQFDKLQYWKENLGQSSIYIDVPSVENL
ncbi:hypothetical protein VP01_896g6 [Puccinia sorghi]|uniref:Uncharacterized protein n=1 Tax=Puccinia sorghi TaxID=27349 RepID=A0A0L6U7W9_9BASI|nr:hypothetical protein VP01_896g6 [Puccinia sorghi]